jgi:hypothetical protein
MNYLIIHFLLDAAILSLYLSGILVTPFIPYYSSS